MTLEMRRNKKVSLLKSGKLAPLRGVASQR